MAEQAFRSPGFFEQEIDRSILQDAVPTGVPAGVISTSNKGPAFVPVTVSSFADFRQKFGDLDTKKFGPYAANEFLKHRSALTFLRLLGAGTMETTSDIAKFTLTGQVRNAGFNVTGTTIGGADSRHKGAVQFLAARHTLQTNEAFGMPMFSLNDSYNGSAVNLIRGMVLLTSGTRMMVLDGNENASTAFTALGPDDTATVSGGVFKLVLSSTIGSSWSASDGFAGIKILTASMNPTSDNYFGKLLNRDPDKFATELHLLYADFAVDEELATPTTVGVLSGSASTSSTSGDSTMSFRDAFGHFDTRYTTPRSPSFISQPFGKMEYDLFYVESLDDGEYANSLYKISVTSVKKSTDQSNPYGTFTLLVRDWDDDDTNPKILEQFPNCSLNPRAENYIARVVGDRKVFFNFDSDQIADRRLTATGKYPNRSKLIRVVVTDEVDRSIVPPASLPFGFRGFDVLKTNDNLTDTATGAGNRLGGVLGVGVGSALTGSIVPPVPFRFKITRGDLATTGFVGNPGTQTVTNMNYFWGVKFERNNDALNANTVSEKNKLVESLTKFVGIKKLDTVISGSGADVLNNNKFTLAKVAFFNSSTNDLTGTVETHMKEAAYIRDAQPDPTTYTVSDGTLSSRITFATLAAMTSSAEFNRFSPAMKFTTFMQGGFDGLNITDKSARRMNDRATSFDTGGGASTSFVSPGLAQNQHGAGASNSLVSSIKTAVEIMTSKLNVNLNILTIPGIRDPYITEYAAKKVRDYGLALYIMDIPSYDDSNARVFDDSTNRPDVTNTAKSFDSRAIDNNYTATYFPDVIADDPVNSRRVKVPASIAALAALALNDRVAYPWYAPAGFNRASLEFVKNVAVRLNGGDRDILDDARINPIAPFPPRQFVIFAQKTLQQANTALNRVNVRRLVVEVKRQVVDIANRMVFEQNTNEVRTKFVSDVAIRLGLIQTQFGIESYRVIMDERNNSTQDMLDNRVNGSIEIVPTRAIEKIGIDFIITNSGVDFV